MGYLMSSKPSELNGDYISKDKNSLARIPKTLIKKAGAIQITEFKSSLVYIVVGQGQPGLQALTKK